MSPASLTSASEWRLLARAASEAVVARRAPVARACTADSQAAVASTNMRTTDAASLAEQPGARCSCVSATRAAWRRPRETPERYMRSRSAASPRTCSTAACCEAERSRQRSQTTASAAAAEDWLSLAEAVAGKHVEMHSGFRAPARPITSESLFRRSARAPADEAATFRISEMLVMSCSEFALVCSSRQSAATALSHSEESPARRDSAARETYSVLVVMNQKADENWCGEALESRFTTRVAHAPAPPIAMTARLSAGRTRRAPTPRRSARLPF